MADITALVNYYVNLLIIQYTGRPKAQATIALLADTLLAQGVALDVQAAYNIDTAVGVQLDVIGKYVGIDRYFSGINLSNYFSLIEYSEVSSPPSSPPRWGFTDYADFSSYQYNGTLIYDDIATVQNALTDDNFRILIKLAIARNNMNFSHAAINNAMWALFGSAIRPESTGDMMMQYFIAGQETTLIQAILAKKLLPKPMGVGLQAVINITGPMFSLADYTGYESPFGYGFSDYANYNSLAGQVLQYNQIIEA